MKLCIIFLAAALCACDGSYVEALSPDGSKSLGWCWERGTFWANAGLMTCVKEKCPEGVDIISNDLVRCKLRP